MIDRDSLIQRLHLLCGWQPQTPREAIEEEADLIIKELASSESEKEFRRIKVRADLEMQIIRMREALEEIRVDVRDLLKIVPENYKPLLLGIEAQTFQGIGDLPSPTFGEKMMDGPCGDPKCSCSKPFPMTTDPLVEPEEKL